MISCRVSIVCIFLDAERFLAEALDSALGQEFQDFELVLVDDGSTDASTAIARAEQAKLPGKVRYLDHPGHANLGMSASRNRGTRASHGEFIAYLDSDDVWRPHKLGEQVAILESEPGAAMVAGRVNYWRSWNGCRDRLVQTGSPVGRLSRPPRPLLDIYPLGPADSPCPSDAMIRRSAFDAVGGWEDEFTGAYEDSAFFSKIYASAPVLFSDATWTDYRLHDHSSTGAAGGEAYAEKQRKFLDWLGGYADAHAIPDRDEISTAIGRARWELGHPTARRWLRRVRSVTRRWRW